MSLAYKKCTIQDLDVLIKISKQTFVDAFEKYNHPDDFKMYMDAAFNKEKIQEELEHPYSEFYFVVLDALRAGYFKLNTGSAQNEVFSNAMELERIYIFKEFQSQGIGAKVLNRVIEMARLKDYEYLWLGVWEHNKKAIQFYKRHDFFKFDSHPFYLGKDLQTDILMKLNLV